MSRRVQKATLALCFAVALSVQLAAGRKAKHEPPATGMEQQKRALHALNRLAFGPRPGDLERIRAVGVDRWIDQQLHPEKIDDHLLESRLARFRTLRMDTREIVQNFPPPQVIKAVAEGKQPLPSDRAQRAVYKAQLERYVEKQERKQEAANTDPPSTEIASTGKRSDEKLAHRREDRLYADL